jgi:tRNA/rRNA methyltransferase
VQVVAYELFMLSSSKHSEMRKEKPATVADLEGLYGHLEQAAIESEFYDPASNSKLPTRLRRLFSRVPDLEREEVNIVRGLLKALLKAKAK